MEDFENRKKQFLDFIQNEYRSKMTELQCDMYNYPQYVPDGKGGFITVIQTEIVDIEGAGMKSPFQV